MIDLKPCPFCGRKDKLIVHEIKHELDNIEISQYTVVCDASGDNTGCGGNCGYGHFTKEEAIEAWNRRGALEPSNVGDAIHNVDALEVVRCEDCIWYDKSTVSGTYEPVAYKCKLHQRFTLGNMFCSDGEKDDA